jgi:putative transposase
MIRSERRWSSAKVIEALADVIVVKGVPQNLRSDDGPEFACKWKRACRIPCGRLRTWSN